MYAIEQNSFSLFSAFSLYARTTPRTFLNKLEKVRQEAFYWMCVCMYMVCGCAYGIQIANLCLLFSAYFYNSLSVYMCVLFRCKRKFKHSFVSKAMEENRVMRVIACSLGFEHCILDSRIFCSQQHNYL